MPADTIDLIEHQIRTGTGVNQIDTNLERISVSTMLSKALKTLKAALLKSMSTVKRLLSSYSLACAGF
jgi:hypothetical protein